jgi:hypothetical protein
VEGAWPIIVDKTIFNQTQAMLAGRAPTIIHPREVDSPYLLSGIMRCGACGAAMVGHGGRQHYRYYICGNARRKGREVCSSPLLPKNRIEGFIIDRIRGYVLTEENLQELVRLTNEELARASDECRNRLELLDNQIAEVDSRLSRLYDALELGSFQSGELAPRIRELIRKKEELQQARADVEETLYYENTGIVDDRVVRDYAGKLRSLLAKSSITEQRNVINSFCKRIEVNDTEVKMYYTVPVPPDSATEETVGVVPIVHHG